MKLEVKIEVPERVKRLLRNPTPQITKAIRKADRIALPFLRKAIARAAPIGKTGDLSKSIEVNLASRRIFSNLPYARAVELGHYVEADSGKWLRFDGIGQRTGIHVFLKSVRTEKQLFFFKTLSKHQIDIIRIYKKAFKKLLESL